MATSNTIRGITIAASVVLANGETGVVLVCPICHKECKIKAGLKIHQKMMHGGVQLN